MANEIYDSSYWGNPTANDFGNIYYQYTGIIAQYKKRVISDNGAIENLECIKI